MFSYLTRGSFDGGIGTNSHHQKCKYRSNHPDATVHTKAMSGHKISLDKEQHAPRGTFTMPWICSKGGSARLPNSDFR